MVQNFLPSASEKLMDIVQSFEKENVKDIIHCALDDVKQLCSEVKKDRFFIQEQYMDSLHTGFKNAFHYSPKVAVFFAQTYLDEAKSEFSNFDGEDQATCLKNATAINYDISQKYVLPEDARLEHDFSPKHVIGFWDRRSINKKHSKLIRQVANKVSQEPAQHLHMIKSMDIAQSQETDYIILTYLDNINGMFEKHLETHGRGSHKPGQYLHNNTVDDYQLLNQKIRSTTAKRVQEFGWSIEESEIVRACDRVNKSLSHLTMKVA